MTLEEAKKILKEEGYDIEKVGRPCSPSIVFTEYESPEICEAMQIVCSAGFQLAMLAGVFDERKERLKKESGQLNDECDAARNSIKQYIDGIACDENDVLSIEVEKAKNGLLPAKDVMDLIDRLLTQDNDKKTAIQKSISDADKAL